MGLQRVRHDWATELNRYVRSPKSRDQQTDVSSGGYKGELVSFSFPPSRGHPYSLTSGLFLQCWKFITPSSALLSHLIMILTPLSFSDSDPSFCHYIRITQIIQDNLSMSRSLLITSAMPLLSHRVMNAKVVYIRIWTSLWVIVQLTIMRKEIQELVSTKTYPKSYG